MRQAVKNLGHWYLKKKKNFFLKNHSKSKAASDWGFLP